MFKLQALYSASLQLVGEVQNFTASPSSSELPLRVIRARFFHTGPSSYPSWRVDAIFLAPLRLKGRPRTLSLWSTTTLSGASGLQAQSVLVPSTSTSRSDRRVPPPRGLPLCSPFPGTPFGFP